MKKWKEENKQCKDILVNDKEVTAIAELGLSIVLMKK